MRVIELDILTGLVKRSGREGAFGFFLGAGCSVTSGIPAAAGIVAQIKRDLYAESTGVNDVSAEAIDAWAKSRGMLQAPDQAYSEALDLIAPTPRLRREYLERFLRQGKPSAGYEALGALVRDGLLRTMFTTNFDRLIEESTGRTTLRVVTHDEAARDFGVDQENSTLYKLHGDYLFDRMANTREELAQLGQRYGTRLAEMCRNYGLVVIGYSGSDESVMTVLEGVAQEADSFPLGLFWLSLDPSSLSGRVVRLLELTQNGFAAKIAGFDEFMTQANRRTVVGSNPRGRDASRPFFVCEADGVDGVVGAVLEALGTRSNELIVISGLPGVGKSATARFIASDPRFAGGGTVIIDAHNRSLTVGEIVDELGSALGVPGPERIGMTTSNSHVLDGDRYRSTLLVVDGVDSQGSEVMELFFALAEKMHVLVTTRSSSRLRSLSSNLWEVEHGGLSMAEMRALMDHVVNRDPLLKAKFERSDQSSIEAFLAASNGWPEALLINIGLLQRTTGSVVDIQTDITRNVYDVLLGGMYAGLQSDERRCLRATVYFPSSFTVDGLRRVGHISRGRAEAAVTNLVRCHLVEELPVGNFSWAHPTIRDFVLRTAAPREPSSQHDRAKRYLEEYVRANGGQPRNDWGNFRRLDLEFTNLRSVMERLLDSSQLDKLTELVKDLFSYIVERGHWAYMDSMCRRVLASDLESHDRANWLIWHSWINLYLLEAPAASASLAEEAATMATGDDSLLFEARRRALLAFAKLGNAEKVEQCLEDVAGLARGFPADGDEIMDAENSSGRAILAVYGSDSGQVHRARDHFRRARKAGESQRAVNSREVAEAILGEAKCAAAIASDSEALRQAESALTQTLAIGWLRGQLEANGLVAALAKDLGDETRSTAAERDAENVRALIRELGGADSAG